MKKNQTHPILDDNYINNDQEIIKAAAQAWHAHQSGARPAATTSEFDARRLNFKARPTRFAGEASRKASINQERRRFSYYDGSVRISDDNNGKWDFGQSLWDCYEIVAVAKKLEAGLMLDHPFSSSLDDPTRNGKNMHKESKHSLRNLFSKITSKRFSGGDVPSD